MRLWAFRSRFYSALPLPKGAPLVKVKRKGGKMATAQSSLTGSGTQLNMGGAMQQQDKAESLLKKIDQTTQDSTGISLFHILTFGSIGASLALFFAGKKQAGIFVGLWPPTFQALKAVVDKKQTGR
jgi:hypothetical protein